MKMLIQFALAFPTMVTAQLATSPSYTLLPTNTPGGLVQNATGTITANVEAASPTAGGTSATTPGGIHTIANFTGQLYDPVSLAVTAAPATIDEAATSQLTAVTVMDDATTLAAGSGDVAWSVDSGPIAAIAPGGLATADTVYQDEIATARGTLGGIEGTAEITILNTSTDDLGLYAGDGIDDLWQATFFGLENPDALPGRDPDGDGQDNRFEFIAGIAPDDPNSRFAIEINLVPGQPAHRDIVFSPIVAGHSYVVVAAVGLGGAAPVPLVGSTLAESGDERTVTDTAASDPDKYYRVEITRP